MPDVVRLRAPAKLNLALSVGPPAVDRMHPISSWMVTLDLCDDVELVRLEPPTMSLYAVRWHEDATRKEEIDWPLARDLAFRAHHALQEAVGRELPMRLRIDKRIPLGGGLGGGSSNAAAVLRGVNELYELGLDDDALVEIAAPLGSDVPFLVRGGSAIVEGLGEKLHRHDDVPELDAVLVLPEFGCPTGRVYAWFDDLNDDGAGAALQSERVHALATAPIVPESPFNDLAAAALEVAPPLGELMRQVSEIAERPAHVTGSGSTLFVVCEAPVHAEVLANALRERLGCVAIPVRAAAT